MADLWLVSRVCEEFGCLPLAARAELEQDPERMIEQILPLRAYARTKQVYEDHCQRGAAAGALPAMPLMGEVLKNEYRQQVAGRARVKDGGRTHD